MRLRSPRFSGSHNLQLAAQNNPVIKYGALGEHVRHVQLALDDIGHKLPKSITPATGTVGRSPDGDFGGETKSMVIEFQRAQKKKNPDFGVDGIVGEQTLTAFDNDSRLQAPVTLPPLAGIRGATDEDGNLLESIIQVLGDARLSQIRFTAMGVSISMGSYLLVRNAMEEGKITARVEPLPADVLGIYFSQAAPLTTGGSILANTFMMSFSRATTTEQKVTIIHEATHAFCDFRRIGQQQPGGPVIQPFSRDQSESVAHIAQATFHRILSGNAQTDPLTSNPTLGLNPVFSIADQLAQQVLANQTLPQTLLGQLHTEVQGNRILIGQLTGSLKPNTTNFDGV